MDASGTAVPMPRIENGIPVVAMVRCNFASLHKKRLAGQKPDMASERTKPNILLQLAAEGIAPLVAGCANALTANSVGPKTRATAAEPATAIDLFGHGIVEKWREWFTAARSEERAAAPAELAALSPAAVREQAQAALAEHA